MCVVATASRSIKACANATTRDGFGLVVAMVGGDVEGSRDEYRAVRVEFPVGKGCWQVMLWCVGSARCVPVRFDRCCDVGVRFAWLWDLA